MPYTRPQIDDEINGSPPQPIPLRLVPFITGWSLKQLLEYLSELQFERYVLLTAYEYRETKFPGEVDKKHFAELLLKISDQEQLQNIPSNHFIWSDKLAWAYHQHLELHYPGEEKPTHIPKLIWDPALGENASLIHECSDFYKVLPKSLKYSNRIKKKNAKNQERDKRLNNEFLRLKKLKPSLTPNAASKQIAKSSKSEGLGFEAIRKAIRPFTKELKK